MEPRKLLTLLMASQNLNPNSLAEKIKHATTQSQIHRFETGKTNEPKQATLRPVADFFGLPVEAFYSEELADTIAERLKAGKPLLDPAMAQYAPFLAGDTSNVTAVPKGKGLITWPPMSPEADLKLERFLRTLRHVPHNKQVEALIAATEELLDRLP